MKKLLLAASLALASTHSVAALSMGDLAFTSFNVDEDGFSVVALANIAASTTIYFQDNEYIAGAFNTGESLMTWNTGSAVINAGTVVRFSAIDVAARAASIGSFSLAGNPGLRGEGDAIYAFTGTSGTAPTTFLSAISSDSAVSFSGTGLTAGTNAIVITPSADYAAYTGARNTQTTFAAYAGLVNNVANWTIQVDGASVAGVIPSTTAFAVAPVPEPSEYAMMGVGLALVGALARRRNRK